MKQLAFWVLGYLPFGPGITCLSVWVRATRPLVALAALGVVILHAQEPNSVVGVGNLHTAPTLIEQWLKPETAIWLIGVVVYVVDVRNDVKWLKSQVEKIQDQSAKREPALEQKFVMRGEFNEFRERFRPAEYNRRERGPNQ